MKPASLPKYMAVITVMAVTGLKPGIGANRKRPTTDSATMAAISIISLASALPCSKCKKKGRQESTATHRVRYAYCLLPKSKDPPTTAAGTSTQRMIYEIIRLGFKNSPPSCSGL